MKYIIVGLLATAAAFAYITPPDQVLIDGRILHTSSQPLASFPWPKDRPVLSEHPNQEFSHARELEALWEIKGGRLYLLAVSAFRFDGFAPRHAIGLRDLMPDRIREGIVFAEWFTGDFEVIERERVDPQLLLRPQDAPPMRVVLRKFRVTNGKVTEVQNMAPSRQPPAASDPAVQKPR